MSNEPKRGLGLKEATFLARDRETDDTGIWNEDNERRAEGRGGSNRGRALFQIEEAFSDETLDQESQWNLVVFEVGEPSSVQAQCVWGGGGWWVLGTW